MARVLLLGIPIDPVTPQEAITLIRTMLTSNAQHHVMTPNSEMLVEAHRNPAFRNLLNRTALNLPDSAGLLWAAKWTGQLLPERVTGVDTVQSLCAVLDESVPVFLLGAAEGVAAQAADRLMQQNPHLKIAGTFAGSPREEDAQSIIQTINASGAMLLLVAYGAPQQDIWIDRYLTEMPGVRVAMGVGGTFDFIAGIQKRAPAFMRKMGLEWLWRVAREPKRIGRIWRAVVVFPWLVVIKSTKH